MSRPQLTLANLSRVFCNTAPTVGVKRDSTKKGKEGALSVPTDSGRIARPVVLLLPCCALRPYQLANIMPELGQKHFRILIKGSPLFVHQS